MALHYRWFRFLVPVVVTFWTAGGDRALAQISADDTLGAEQSRLVENVLIRGATGDRIEGGAARGVNLFHSFAEFNVGNGERVYFDNPAAIENIFSRVTGGNISSILGTLGVDGDANLYLLNPNGILFGPNAQLDIGGSFLATTADRFLFPNGEEFSAVNPQAAPLLNVNVPIGLQYGANPGAISAQGSTLLVNPGEQLTLAGGQIELNNVFLNAAGGQINLIGVGGAGTIQMVGERFAVPETVPLADITLIATFIDNGVPAGSIQDSGDIEVTSNALFLTNRSFLDTTILGQGNAGDIIINARDRVLFDNGFAISGIFFGATGQGGNIRITADSLALENFSGLTSDTLGQGDAGDIILTINDRIFLDDSIISTGAFTGSVGQGGTTQITADSLILENGSILTSGTFGQGDAGDIILTINDRIFLDDSRISTGAFTGSVGQGGTTQITADSLILENGSGLTSGTLGQGDAGDIILTVDDRILLDNSFILTNVSSDGLGQGGEIRVRAGSFLLTNRTVISANTAGMGDAGNIILEVDDRLFSERSLISNAVEAGAMGQGGILDITAGSVVLTNLSELSTSTSGDGNAGDFIIRARDQIQLDQSFLNATSTSDVGNSGSIRLETGDLTLRNESGILTTTSGRGNAGTIAIAATGQVLVESGSIIITNMRGTGDPGQITLDARSLIVQSQGVITTRGDGDGDAGDLTIRAQEFIRLDQGRLSASAGGLNARNELGSGNSGDILIETAVLDLNESSISNSGFLNRGNVGTLIINSSESIQLRGDSRITAGILAFGTGLNGRLSLTTRNLQMQDTSFLSTVSRGLGDGGRLEILGADSITLSGGSLISTSSSGFGNGGDIQIETGVFQIVDAGISTITNSGEEGFNLQQIVPFQILEQLEPDAIVAIEQLAEALSEARAQEDLSNFRAGNVTIRARERLNLLEDSGILTSGQGLAASGAILLETPQLRVQGGLIASATLGSGDAAPITIRDAVLVDFSDGVISAETTSTGDSSDIVINTDRLRVRDGARLSATTRGEGRAGSILVRANESIEVIGASPENDPDPEPSIIRSSVNPSATGRGGSVTLFTPFLSIRDGGNVSVGTSGRGDAGRLRIVAPEQVEVTGTSADGRFRSEITASVEPNATGQGGVIEISTGELRVSDRAQILASTSGQGDAGDILIRDADQVTLSSRGAISTAVNPGAIGRGGNILITTDTLQLTGNARVSAESAIARGVAGNVQIIADQLAVEDRSRIAVSNPRGQAGNLTIRASEIWLDQGTLSAETGGRGAQVGAVIELQDLEQLVMQNQSLISARASNRANGGNIIIDAAEGFIVATPFENNDIIATAERGTGGNISIRATRLFGFADQTAERLSFEQLRANDTSDISASSQFGAPGVITFDLANVDPSRGLAELPETIVDASQQIARQCGTGSGITEEELGEFVITGRGGLPFNPDDLQNNEIDTAGLISLESDAPPLSSASLGEPQQEVEQDAERFDPRSPIVEAQGWTTGANGEVMLVANAVPPLDQRAIAPHFSCIAGE